MVVRCQFAHSCELELATDRQMQVPFKRDETINALKETGKRQALAFFTISCELATGNWQPDANSTLEDLIQF